MHILLTNDDGPPSNQSSPYVHTLVSSLQQAGHKVSVCLPNVQRSWIGKAHIIGQTLTPSYFRPGTILKDDGVVSDRPFNDGKEEWVLIDGTPASCVQIGLHHVFKDGEPIDVVVSGPNYGRNTTAIFALSSGTIGGAMEGAVNGVKSIALSYAFDSREHDADIIAAASRVSTRLIEKFVNNWPKDVHLYSINVPLRHGVEQAKILYTEMIQNQWQSSSFTELPTDAPDADPNKEEEKIRDGANSPAGSEKPSGRRNHVTFKWSPYFADVRASVEKAGKGDGWEVLQGHITVTPLRASFWHLPHYTGEIKLDPMPQSQPQSQNQSQHQSLHTHSVLFSQKIVYAVVDYPDAYVQPLLLQSLANSPKVEYRLIPSIAALPVPDAPVLQYTAYEALNFDHAIEHARSSLLSAYVIRKALIRKHYLSNTISTWLVKHPDSILAKHFKPAVHFELDFAEFLDDALVDAWDLNESLEQNEATTDASKRQWWILKPGMSDGGNGIRLFSTLAELQAIFEEWDPEEIDEEEEEEVEEEDEKGEHDAAGDRVRQGANLDSGKADPTAGSLAMTSQLRHFIAQPYIDPPLLLPSLGSRKFHIRTYVVVVGAVKVFVYREMLALFAARAYQPPGLTEINRSMDLGQHLTNTCFQDATTRNAAVHRFWALSDPSMSPGLQERLFEQICATAAEVTVAAAQEQMVHFQTLPNAFEIFGVDFLVDGEENVWLLEFNAYPDFQQTGDSLQDVVIGGLFEELVKVAVDPFFGVIDHAEGTKALPLIKSLDLGRR